MLCRKQLILPNLLCSASVYFQISILVHRASYYPASFFLLLCAFIKPHAILLFLSLVGAMNIFGVLWDRDRLPRYVFSILLLAAAFGVAAAGLR